MNKLFFFKTDEYTSCDITAQIKLHIKGVNSHYAVLYFTDNLSNKIDIPPEIIVCTDYEHFGVTRSTNQEYKLPFTDGYIIKWNEHIIIRIQNHRHWNIHVKKQRLTHRQQMENLIKQFGIESLPFPVVYRFEPLNEIACEIRQRSDTGEYVMISFGSSWRDDTDNYFRWNVVVLNESKLLEYEKYKIRKI